MDSSSAWFTDKAYSHSDFICSTLSDAANVAADMITSVDLLGLDLGYWNFSCVAVTAVVLLVV